MRKYKQEIIWQEIEQAANNLARLGLVSRDDYDKARHELRRGVRTAMERIEAREKLEARKRKEQVHNNRAL